MVANESDLEDEIHVPVPGAKGKKRGAAVSVLVYFVCLVLQ